jgi:DNA-binding MarR family transcriptional regulator
MTTRTVDETDDAARTLRAAIRALVRRFSISERADTACCGLTVAQAATLEVLAVEGPLRLGELGRRLGIAPSTLTRNLSRLEASGLAKRQSDKADGRAGRVGLTSAGRRAAAHLERQEQAFARQILEALPSERRAMAVEALVDLLGVVRQATEACCPGAFDHLMQGMPRASSRAEGEGCDGTGCGA